MNKFQENWNKVDEVCPHCNQITKRQKGMTKQNLKRLITPQFNMNEILITFMLIMVIVLAYVYLNETKQSRDWIIDMTGEDKQQCFSNCNLRCENFFQTQLNLTTLTNLTNELPNSP